MENEKKYSYVTLLSSNDFMPGLVAMLYSYNRVKNPTDPIPMTVMVTPDISQVNRDLIQHAFDARVIEVEPITLPDAEDVCRYLFRHKRKAVHICMAKFHIFALNLSKAVYVDADMIFLRNTDELFDKPSFSFVKDFSAARNGSFNSGIFVAEPNPLVRDLAMNTLYDNFYGKDYDVVDDQMIMDLLLPEWPEQTALHLPFIYNYQAWDLSAYMHAPSYFLDILSEVKILHMMGYSKPWITPSY